MHLYLLFSVRFIINTQVVFAKVMEISDKYKKTEVVSLGLFLIVSFSPYP